MDHEPNTIPELKLELLASGLIRLEQNFVDDYGVIDIHPVHLRYMAEKFGLVATSDPLATKTIAMLTRRLLLLRERIEYLDDMLTSANVYPPGPKNGSVEEIYSCALLDLANEFVADLVSADSASETGRTE